MDEVVIDASAFVDLLLSEPLGGGRRGEDHWTRTAWSGPSQRRGHVRPLSRAGLISDRAIRALLERVVDAPIVRHPLAGLLFGAWRWRANLRLADALYVELAESLDLKMMTTDLPLESELSRSLFYEQGASRREVGTRP